MITPGHKRALNRALHELRRPLQALVLLEEGSGRLAATPPAASRRGLLELAVSALRDLDGTINGGPQEADRKRFLCREVVLACLERWRPVAARAGGVRVYWDAGPAPMVGDATRLAQALDNLIANAIEHGAPPIVVTGARVAERVRITIANGDGDRRPSPADTRRGHGTEIVSEVASAHGGRFALCHTGRGCVAALELPLAEPGYAQAA
ncbi:MAG: sensor histidine kinase [Solirubrobacterales bacterium]|nr:HAMP domain-containing sensor histidine kinase [Solirubrobacterales bacterium]